MIRCCEMCGRDTYRRVCEVCTGDHSNIRSSPPAPSLEDIDIWRDPETGHIRSRTEVLCDRKRDPANRDEEIQDMVADLLHELTEG